MPDVLFQLRGLRVVIEGKFEDVPNTEEVVLGDARKRVSSGLAHIATAVIYPKALRTAPTTKIIEILRKSELRYRIVTETHESDWFEGTPTSIMDALRRAQEALTQDDIVERTARALSERLEGVAALWMGQAGARDLCVSKTSSVFDCVTDNSLNLRVRTPCSRMNADGWRMVTQEGAPALRRWATTPGHVSGDGRLSHRKAEFEQLTMNARRTPQQVLHAHPPDQRPQIRMDLGSACQGAGFPAPMPAKAGAMSAHEGLRPEDRHGLEDRRKPTIQLDEEQAIAVREVDATAYVALENNQLTLECGILCFKPAFRLEERGNQVQEEEYQRDHRRRR